MIKLLLGGSPCTHWSVAQRNNRQTVPEGVGWELFKNYLIAKEKFKPDFFLYENNKSTAPAIKDQISKELGVGTDPNARFTYINSALVSAQNRQRFYVTNFGDITQPKDRGVLLKDILETGSAYQKKLHCLTASYNGAVIWNSLERGQSSMVAEPVCVAQRGRYIGNTQEAQQQYEARVDGKTNTLTTVSKDNLICEPVRVGDLPNEKGEISGSQATRIYALVGKSVNLIANGGGQGAKTGLYAIPVEGKVYAVAVEFDGDIPIKAISNADGKTYPVYCVSNGEITIKEKRYPVKLEDGYYIIRKLTVAEAARLQTMPDDYCRAVSASQGYKGLGNGWTAEVIIHLLQHMNVPLDEEIVVLSMYDGIGTGRCCLNKMGYKNVKYYATEIDKYAMQVSMSNYPDIIQLGDAFQVREDGWRLPNT